MDNKAYKLQEPDFKDKLKEKFDEEIVPAAEIICDTELNADYELVKRRLKKKCIYLGLKRLLDIISSFLGIIILGLPMIIIAIAVKCTSKGPAIFKTERVGKKGKSFKFYKFRSMTVDAPEDCAPMYLESTSYITKIGAFLRKTSLDELPQLFNILSGKMSVVGPRPSGLSEHELIELREKNGSLLIKPGLTGWAQINGRDITASIIEKKAKYDGEYAKKIGFWFDVKIFFRTIGKVFRHSDVVEGKEVNEEENTEMNDE